MLAQAWGGSVVNMASVGGMVATPGASVYVASKHAVIGLTRAAAVEYGPHGVRVNAVSPGAIRTGMLHQVFGDDAVLDRMASVHPMRRLGFPDDVADAVASLAVLGQLGLLHRSIPGSGRGSDSAAAIAASRECYRSRHSARGQGGSCRVNPMTTAMRQLR
jgi:NAD(P)-dependent dehydrogenase (short-subunit alcohol dehydrogenase family)